MNPVPIRPARLPGLLAFGLWLALSACSSGGAETGNSGGGGGGGGDPGGGGGSGGGGGTGNPLNLTPEFTVRNEHDAERTETMLASVPFPEGVHRTTDTLGVSGQQTAWRVLQRWADGSIRVAQAQFTDTLPARSVRTYRVVRDVQPLTGAFTPNNWVQQLSSGLQYGAEVRDTFGVAYRSFVNGPGELLVDTPLQQVRRHRTYHRAATGTGIGRDYLTSTFYTQAFRDVPVLIVDWVLGNDYLGRDDTGTSTDPNLFPLGGVDVREARFLVQGAPNVHAYRAATEAIEAPAAANGGFTGYRVMRDTWLGDAQTRRYRFVLGMVHPNGAQPERERWQQTIAAMVQSPLFPLCTRDTWAQTGGLGLLGGPLAGPADAWNRAEAEFQNWSNANHFGTWGSRGDPLATGTTGTPRNHPLSPELAHAVQANHPRLLVKLEQMAWTQAMRPYHLFRLQVGDEQNLLLWDGVPIYPGSRDLSHESLGRRALYRNDPYTAYRTMVPSGSQRAHGFEHYDHEHWSTDLLFDYWTMTGDAWAQEELRQLGQSLKSLMRLRTYSTRFIQAVRAEGWTMQGFAQVFLATGDPSIKDYALRRVREVVEPQRMQSHASKALAFQSNYAGTGFPLNHRFYMPWQHGALLYGYLGAYRFFRDPQLLRICEDSVTAVQYAWLTNYQDPQRGLVANGLRYYVPTEHNGTPVAANYFDATVGVRWGDSPLGGAHIFLIGGLLLLADTTQDAALRTRALQYGRLLRNGPLSADSRWNKWRFVLPEHHAQ